jgi:phage FluMu protein Com
MTALRPKHVRCSNLLCTDQIYFLDPKCPTCKTVNPLEYLPEGATPRPLGPNGFPVRRTFDDDPIASYAFYSSLFGKKSCGVVAYLITQIEMACGRRQRLAYERDPSGYLERKISKNLSKAHRTATANRMKGLVLCSILLSVPSIIGILLLMRLA